MSSAEVTFAIVLAIGAAELFDYFCWLSKRLVHRAAYLRYGDSERARDRAEQWADIIESRPGQVLKLATALGFLIAGAYHAGHRRVRAAGVLSRLRGFAFTPRGLKVLMAYLAVIYGSGGAALAVSGVHFGMLPLLIVGCVLGLVMPLGVFVLIVLLVSTEERQKAIADMLNEELQEMLLLPLELAERAKSRRQLRAATHRSTK